MAKDKQRSKIKPRVVEVEFPMFANARVDVYIGTYKEITSKLGAPDGYFSDSGYYARTAWHEDHPNKLMVHMTDVRYCDLAHEALHCAHRIADYIGHNPDHHNDEFLAYLLGYIVQCVEDEINREHRRNG